MVGAADGGDGEALAFVFLFFSVMFAMRQFRRMKSF
jgi:hypothetical protein